MTRLLNWLGLNPWQDTSWVDDPIVDDPPLTLRRQALELGFVVVAVVVLAACLLVVAA